MPSDDKMIVVVWCSWSDTWGTHKVYSAIWTLDDEPNHLKDAQQWCDNSVYVHSKVIVVPHNENLKGLKNHYRQLWQKGSEYILR